MKKESNALFIMFLVLALTIAYAWFHMLQKGVKGVDSLDPYFLEGFEGAPTRAVDCRCLTGYVPSKNINSPFGGKVIKYKNDIHFVPTGTNQRFYVPSCTMCGSDLNFCTEAKVVNESEFKAYKQASKILDCTLWNSVKGKKETEAYFCQKLGSPSETMFCY